jgi:hypothetical protein
MSDRVATLPIRKIGADSLRPSRICLAERSFRISTYAKNVLGTDIREGVQGAVCAWVAEMCLQAFRFLHLRSYTNLQTVIKSIVMECFKLKMRGSELEDCLMDIINA